MEGGILQKMTVEFVHMCPRGGKEGQEERRVRLSIL